jgi:hypothetical protein
MALPLLSLAMRAGIPAARSGLRFLSKMKKPKGGGITLYRGEQAKPIVSLKETAKMYNPSKIPSKFDFNNPELRKLAMGRWFSDSPGIASGYAGNSRFLSMFKNPKEVLSWGGGYRPGVVKKVTLSPKEANMASRLAHRIHNVKTKPGKAWSSNPASYMFVLPKKALGRIEVDKLRTFLANMKRMMGKKHGGLARILEV